MILIPIKEVCRRTGLSRSTIYCKFNYGSKYYDEKFPRPVKVGSGNAIRFLELEVNEWIEFKLENARC